MLERPASPGGGRRVSLPFSETGSLGDSLVDSPVVEFFREVVAAAVASALLEIAAAAGGAPSHPISVAEIYLDALPWTQAPQVANARILFLLSAICGQPFVDSSLDVRGSGCESVLWPHVLNNGILFWAALQAELRHRVEDADSRAQYGEGLAPQTNGTL